MAQGLRGRLALLGAGVVLCSGLTGCMTDDKKPISSLPTAKGTGPAAPPGATIRQPGPTTGFSAGAPTGYQNQGGMQPASGTMPYDPMSANPAARNSGGMNRPAVTGQMGPGAPFPGPASSSIAPSVMPNSSSGYQPGLGGYQPGAGSGYQLQPGNLGSMSPPPAGSSAVTDPVTGTTISRGAAPTSLPHNPPPMQLSEVPTPPPAPPVASVNPSVAPPADAAAPLAPLAPTAPPSGIGSPVSPYGSK